MTYRKIIICGRRATGKTTLFWDLQKALGWPIFSVSEYLRDFIHRFNLRNVDDVLEKSPDISRDIDDRIRMILEGESCCVLDVRIYGYMDSVPPDTLRVLLTANDAVRVARAAYREGTTPDRQKAKLDKKETDWIDKMSKLYNRNDFFDPRYYDLVIDTTNLKPEEVLSTVLQYRPRDQA